MSAVKVSHSKLSEAAKECIRLWLKEHTLPDETFSTAGEVLRPLAEEIEKMDRREWPIQNFRLAVMRLAGRVRPSREQDRTDPIPSRSIKGRKAACKKEIERVMDKAKRSLCRALGRFITKESGVKKKIGQLELQIKAKDKELKDIRNVLNKYEPVESAIMEFSGKKLEMADWVRLVKKLETAVLAARKALQGS